MKKKNESKMNKKMNESIFFDCVNSILKAPTLNTKVIDALLAEICIKKQPSNSNCFHKYKRLK